MSTNRALVELEGFGATLRQARVQAKISARDLAEMTYGKKDAEMMGTAILRLEAGNPTTEPGRLTAAVRTLAEAGGANGLLPEWEALLSRGVMGQALYVRRSIGNRGVKRTRSPEAAQDSMAKARAARKFAERAFPPAPGDPDQKRLWEFGVKLRTERDRLRLSQLDLGKRALPALKGQAVRVQTIISAMELGHAALAKTDWQSAIVRAIGDPTLTGMWEQILMQQVRERIIEKRLREGRARGGVKNSAAHRARRDALKAKVTTQAIPPAVEVKAPNVVAAQPFRVVTAPAVHASYSLAEFQVLVQGLRDMRQALQETEERLVALVMGTKRR